MAKYQYTILSYNEKENERRFLAFHQTKKSAEESKAALVKDYPNFKFTVAAVQVN